MQDVFTKFGYPQYIIADNLPFLSMKCKNYYKNKEITILTCTPHHHQSNGLSEKAVSIGKQILRKSYTENSDFRELLLEYNNSPIINIDASPAQILQSRSLRTQLPVTHNQLEPKIQKHIYKYLSEQKIKTKKQYDKTSRKTVREYRKGDKVVVKSSKDKHWYKAVVLQKANEPRSYWVRKERNNRIVRRNSSQMKLSFTKPDACDIILEPELYFNQQEQNTHVDNMSNDVINDIQNLFIPSSDNETTTVAKERNPDLVTHNYAKSRYGRDIKPVKKLNL